MTAQDAIDKLEERIETALWNEERAGEVEAALAEFEAVAAELEALAGGDDPGAERSRLRVLAYVRHAAGFNPVIQQIGTHP